MEKNLIDGITLIGIAVALVGILQNSSGWQMWLLIISALILCGLGITEVFFNKEK
ncbi:hypothetical protein HOC01_01450 [archaeon]|jgi:hypothetical protein|nr:hypothetical protein [archaeon]MBT6698014.1 hypothetical protein [archaeon]